MSDNKRNGSFAGKGYYIALILCAAAIGITSYVMSRNQPEVQEAAVQETYEDVYVGSLEPEDVPALATEAPQETVRSARPKTTKPAATPTTPAQSVKKELETMAPVANSAIYGYAMEALSYNQTTRDWRVHNGIDYAGEDGEQVFAAAEGTVSAVYEDDTMGYTVEINHIDGYTTSYSSLAENVAVKVGETVAMGQTIGYAGDSAIVESELGSHVHFGVTSYGAAMDPEEFLALGK